MVVDLGKRGFQNIGRQRYAVRGSGGRGTTEERRFARVLALFVLLALLWVVFAPGAGVVALVRKKIEQHHLQEEITHIRRKNVRLGEDIVRLGADPEFLEQEARRRGLLRENELCFDFSDTQ